MERLTERYDIAPDGESDVWVKQHDYISAARKLCDYEDLEEQGLLARLPCKVGDTVYRVNAGAKQPIIPMTVSEIHFLCYKNERAVRFDAIGKEDMGEKLLPFRRYWKNSISHPRRSREEVGGDEK